MLPLSKKLSEQADGRLRRPGRPLYGAITTKPAPLASATAGRMRSARPSASPMDFDTEQDGCVTVRDRDTMDQVRLPIAQLASYIEEKINL